MRRIPLVTSGETACRCGNKTTIRSTICGYPAWWRFPIVFFFFALIKLKLKGYQAGTITVVLALLVALLLYGMPVPQSLASVAYGFLYGLWPIA